MNRFKISNHSVCFSSFMALKPLALFVVLCMFLNGFVPQFSIKFEDKDIAEKIMVSQKAAFQSFFALSALPIQLVTKLLQKEGVLPGGALDGQESSKDNKKENSTTSSAEFSLINLDKKITVSKYTGFTSPFSGQSLLSGIFNINFEDCAPLNTGVLPLIFIVFALMFFVILPRGSIDESFLPVSITTF